MKKKKKTTNSKKSTQDKKNKKLEKTEMSPSVEQPKEIELIGEEIDTAELEKIRKNLPVALPEEIKELVEYKEEIVKYDEEEMVKYEEKVLAKLHKQTNTKPYLPTIFLHFIIGLLKNENFEYPENIGTIDEMVNDGNYHQLLQPFYVNDLAKHFVFQETEPKYNNIPESRLKDRMFIYDDELQGFYCDKDFCKMSDMGDKYILPDFKKIKNFVILFLNKKSEIVTEKFLEKYISDFVQDKLSPNGDYYPFAYQDKKMQELILNLHKIYPKTKKIKLSYDMPLLNDKRFRLPEMLLRYSMDKYISIDEVSITPKDLYFKISIKKNIPETKETSHNIVNILEYKGLSLDVKTGRVEYNGKEIKGVFKYLNTEKFYILEMLMRNPGKLIYINELKETIAARRQRRRIAITEKTLKTTIDRLKRDLCMTKQNKQTQLTISLIIAHKNRTAIQLH